MSAGLCGWRIYLQTRLHVGNHCLQGSGCYTLIKDHQIGSGKISSQSQTRRWFFCLISHLFFPPYQVATARLGGPAHRVSRLDGAETVGHARMPPMRRQRGTRRLAPRHTVYFFISSREIVCFPRRNGSSCVGFLAFGVGLLRWMKSTFSLTGYDDTSMSRFSLVRGKVWPETLVPSSLY